MKPLTLLLGAGAALGLYALVTYKPTRFIGDKAQVGDEVFVPLSSLPGPVQGLPAGVGSVVLQVATASPDVLSGPVVAYVVHELPSLVRIPLATPTPPIQVQRAAVTSVYRAGSNVT